MIRGPFGPKVVVVFLNGACGDITQVDNRAPTPIPSRSDGPAWSSAARGGRGGQGAAGGRAAAPTCRWTPPRRCSRCKRRVPSPERVKQCLELVKQDPKKVGATEWTFAKEIVLLDALIAKSRRARPRCRRSRSGRPCSSPTRPSTSASSGWTSRRRSPFPLTFPVELANGCVGYVPTEEALGPHGGGYETRLTGYSNLEPAAGRQMADAVLELPAR